MRSPPRDIGSCNRSPPTRRSGNWRPNPFIGRKLSMASAASRVLKSSRHAAQLSKPGHRIESYVVAALFVYMAIALARYPSLGLWGETWVAAMLTILLVSLWCAHLGLTGLPKAWNIAAGAPVSLAL